MRGSGFTTIDVVTLVGPVGLTHWDESEVLEDQDGSVYFEGAEL